MAKSWYTPFGACLIALVATASVGACGLSEASHAKLGTPPPLEIRGFEWPGFHLRDMRFAGAHGLACGQDGTCFVSDTYGDHRTVFRITPDGRAAPLRIDHAFEAPAGLRLDAKGNLFVADVSAGTIVEVAPSGKARIVVDRLPAPWNVAIDGNGGLVVACDNGEVWRVDGQGRERLLSAPLEHPFDAEIDGKGRIYVSLHGADDRLAVVRKPLGRVVRIAEDGSVADFATGFLVPEGLELDQDGQSLLVADTQERAVYAVSAAGNRRSIWRGEAPPVHLAWRGAVLVVLFMLDIVAAIRGG